METTFASFGFNLHSIKYLQPIRSASTLFGSLHELVESSRCWFRWTEVRQQLGFQFVFCYEERDLRDVLVSVERTQLVAQFLTLNSYLMRKKFLLVSSAREQLRFITNVSSNGWRWFSAAKKFHPWSFTQRILFLLHNNSQDVISTVPGPSRDKFSLRWDLMEL